MATTKNEAQLLSPKQCAARLAVHPTTITRWVRIGILPAWRIAGVVRIRWSDVLEIVQADGRREVSTQAP